MNKYFLSIIFVLVIFQGFKVFDEIYFKEKKMESSYNVRQDYKTKKNPKKYESNFNKLLEIEEMMEMANIENGKKIFKKCSSCHDISSKKIIKIGPPLWNIIDRNFASIEGYKYSNKLLSMKKIWNYEELFNFIGNPKEYANGTKMNFGGISDSVDRVDLISYLSSLK